MVLSGINSIYDSSETISLQQKKRRSYLACACYLIKVIAIATVAFATIATVFAVLYYSPLSVALICFTASLSFAVSIDAFKIADRGLKVIYDPRENAKCAAEPGKYGVLRYLIHDTVILKPVYRLFLRYD